jgi:hypothetical protein
MRGAPFFWAARPDLSFGSRSAGGAGQDTVIGFAMRIEVAGGGVFAGDFGPAGFAETAAEGGVGPQASHGGGERGRVSGRNA